MTFAQAAKTQYLRDSYYTVWLVGAKGERVRLGSTQRKSGSGLLSFCSMASVQETLGKYLTPSVTIKKKTSTAILLSDGWRIVFGGTIRQEAE